MLWLPDMELLATIDTAAATSHSSGTFPARDLLLIKFHLGTPNNTMQAVMQFNGITAVGNYGTRVVSAAAAGVTLTDQNTAGATATGVAIYPGAAATLPTIGWCVVGNNTVSTRKPLAGGFASLPTTASGEIPTMPVSWTAFFVAASATTQITSVGFGSVAALRTFTCQASIFGINF